MSISQREDLKLTPRVPYMDPMEKERMETTPPVYIWNLSPKEFVEYQGTLGRFVIPACLPGEPISKPLVLQGWLRETAVDSVEGRDVQYKWLWTSGRKLAENLVGIGPMKTDMQNLTKYGVFISAGSEPTDAEYAAAKRAYEIECDKKIKEADDKYQVNGGMEMGDDGKYHSAITIDHITAARYRGVEKPWLFKPQTAQMVTCDECETRNLSTAAKCKQCGIVLNEDAFKAKFPVEWAARQAVLAGPAEDPKRGPGRPRNDERGL